MPDASSASTHVQQQIRGRFAALQAALQRRETPSRELADAFGQMGRIAMAAEYFDVAEACFENARTLEPDEMEWPFFLGHVFRLGNDPARAAAAFRQTLERSPEHQPTLVWLAEMHLALNEPGAAESLLLRAQRLDAGSGAVLFGLGRVALAREQYREAVAYLERAIMVGPQATRIHYPLALAYRGLGQRAKAEAHLRLRGEIDLPPADPLLEGTFALLESASAYEVRGSQAIDERRWEDAVASLRKAIDQAPDNAFSRLNLATSLYMLGKADDALEQYRTAVRLSPGLARAHFGIGVLLSARGQDREAIAAFTEAVRADPGYIEARFSLANALRRAGRVPESFQHYEVVLRANPSISQASFGYAMGLVRVGRYQEARARLEDGVRAYPEQSGFAHALARLLAAAPDSRVRDGHRAVAIMSDILQREQTLAIAETMAMAQAEAERFDDAVGWQRRALAAATDAKRADLVARLTDNLRLYQTRQPCRVPWPDDDPVHRPE